MARNKILSSAGVKCVINGVDMGTVISLQYSIATPRDEERGVDSLLPFELSPTVVQVSGNVQLYKLRNDGGLENRGIVNPPMYIDTERYFWLQLIDRQSGTIYLNVAQASIDGQNWNYSAKGTVTGQFSFKGLVAKADPVR